MSNKMTIKDLEEFFNNTKLSDKAVRLDECTVIHNQEKFVKSHLAVLKSNSGKTRIMPFFERLKKIYLIIKNEK